MKSLLLFGVLGASVVAQGCLTGFTATDATASNGGAGTTATGSSVNATAAGTGGGPTASSSSSSSSTSSGTAACLDVHGTFALGTPTGCLLDPTATQCIKMTSADCSVTFVSKGIGASTGGVDGNVTVDGKGDFTGAMLKVGGMNHADCSGTWAASNKEMAVTCPGAMGACAVTMTRTADTCSF
jgi:hypothetical protein